METQATPAYEGVHEPGPQALWSESWYFDFAAEDGSAGGFVRVGGYPTLGISWWWAYVVCPDRPGAGPAVAGAQLERPIEADRGAPFHLADPELRCAFVADAEGRWRLAADAPGFALDISWRPVAQPHHYSRGSRYEQAGWAEGSVTAGSVTRAVNGPGQRDHSWGVRDWWRFGWTWCAGWLPGGERFQATQLEARGRIDPDGYVVSPDGVLRPVRDVEVCSHSGSAQLRQADPERSPGAGGAQVRLDGRSYALDDVATATVDLVAPDGRRGRLVRSMTVVHSSDGHRGVGWRERNVPDNMRSRPA